MSDNRRSTRKTKQTLHFDGTPLIFGYNNRCSQLLESIKEEDSPNSKMSDSEQQNLDDKQEADTTAGNRHKLVLRAS